MKPLWLQLELLRLFLFVQFFVLASVDDDDVYRSLTLQPPCSPVTIPAHNIVTLENRTIKVTFSSHTFDHGSYNFTDDGVSVCYPLTKRFHNCMHWELEPNEVEIGDNVSLKLKAESGKVVSLGEYRYDESKGGYLVCVPPDALDDYEFTQKTSVVFTVAYGISVAAILVIIVFYVLTPKMKNHNAILLCHMVSLMVLLAMFLLRRTPAAKQGLSCFLIGSITQFAFLATFFWLNVFAFGTWKQFSHTIQNRCDLEVFHVRCFVLQSVYAWGFPFLITATCICFDLKDFPIKPDFADFCWINDYYLALATVYGPIGLLLGFNILLFILTINNLRKMSRELVIVDRTMPKKMFFLSVKLLLVMGITWTGEVISWAVGGKKEWFFLDVFNSLQGLFLFLVFVCKRSTFSKVAQWWKNKRLHKTFRTNSDK